MGVRVRLGRAELIEAHALRSSGSSYQFARFHVVQGIGYYGARITQHASNLVSIGETCLMPVYKSQNIPLNRRSDTQACQALLDLKIEALSLIHLLIYDTLPGQRKQLALPSSALGSRLAFVMNGETPLFGRELKHVGGQQIRR